MFQFFTKFGYLLRETFSGLRRGGWMNWAAISTLTVLLFLFGICLQTSWQLDSLLNHFGSQLEISVYLEADVKAEKIIPLAENVSQVKKVSAISKDEAWESLLKELGISDVEAATEQLEGNPLVDELKVVVSEPKMVPRVVEVLKNIPGVEHCVYINEARERLQQIQRGLDWFSLILTFILSLTAITVVTTTLKLIAISRKNELEIMQFVGATQVWIFLPFVLHGLVFGLVGASIALGLITSLRALISQLLIRQTDLFKFIVEGLKLNAHQLILLPIILVILGILIGMIGSFLALRRLSFK